MFFQVPLRPWFLFNKPYPALFFGLAIVGVLAPLMNQGKVTLTLRGFPGPHRKAR